MIGWRAWLAGVVLCVISVLWGYFGFKKKNVQMIIQSGLLCLISFFFSFYAIFYFLGDK